MRHFIDSNGDPGTGFWFALVLFMFTVAFNCRRPGGALMIFLTAALLMDMPYSTSYMKREGFVKGVLGDIHNSL